MPPAPPHPSPRLEPLTHAARGGAERLALLLALAVLVMQTLPLAAALEWRRELLGPEPWRLLTGHWVHLGWVHAAINAAALLLLARLYSRWLDARALAALLVAANLGVSLALAAALPALSWYRGLSGALHAVFFTGALLWFADARGRERWLPAMLLAGGAVKLVFERGWAASELPWADTLGAAVVPQAHLAGAALGLGAGLVLIGARSRGRNKGARG